MAKIVLTIDEVGTYDLSYYDVAMYQPASENGSPASKTQTQDIHVVLEGRPDNKLIKWASEHTAKKNGKIEEWFGTEDHSDSASVTITFNCAYVSLFQNQGSTKGNGRCSFSIGHEDFTCGDANLNKGWTKQAK